MLASRVAWMTLLPMLLFMKDAPVQGTLHDSNDDEPVLLPTETSTLTLEDMIRRGQDSTFNLEFFRAARDFQNAFRMSAEKEYSILSNASAEASMALDNFKRGHFQEATEIFQRAVERSNKTLFIVLRNIADKASGALRRLQNGEFREAFDIFHDATSSLGFLSYMSRVREAYEHINASNAANDVLANCQEVTKMATDGLSVLQDGKFVEAAEIIHTAANKSRVESVRSVLEKDSQALVLASAGIVLANKGELAKAREKLADACNSSGTKSVSLILSVCLTSISVALEGLDHISRGQFQEASASFQNATDMFKNSSVVIGDLSKILDAYRSVTGIAVLGQALVEEGRFPEALDKFQEAYDTSSAPELCSQFAQCRNAINYFIAEHLLFDKGLFPSSEVLEAGLSHDGCVCMNDTLTEWKNVMRLAKQGYGQLATGNLRNALEYFQLAHGASERDDVREKLANCRDVVDLFLRGQELMERKEFNEAAIKFQEAYDNSSFNDVKYVLSRLKKPSGFRCE